MFPLSVCLKKKNSAKNIFIASFFSFDIHDCIFPYQQVKKKISNNYEKAQVLDPIMPNLRFLIRNID